MPTDRLVPEWWTESFTPRRWIISPLADTVFIIGTPLLIVPLFAIAGHYGLATVLAAFVMSVVSMGHHLPGFLRIYSDPDLFQRYRFRFLFVPIALILGAIWLAEKNLHALLIVTFFWGTWHGMMQVYGFARIYDAKNGETAPWTARLDWWLCLSWFLTLTLSSAFRTQNLRIYATDTGLGALAEVLVAPSLVSALQIWTGGLTIIHLGYTISLWWRGRRASPIKLLMLASTIALLYISYRDFAKNPLVSIALFEAFHDIQYFAIVWAFTTSSGLRGGLNRFGRSIFRPGPLFLGLYVGLVAAYGSVGQLFAAPGTGGSQMVGYLTTVFIVSALLHFYFDGFIWRIRQSSTRVDLHIKDEGNRSTPPVEVVSPYGVRWQFRDIAVQLGLFATPILILVVTETHRRTVEASLYRVVEPWLPETGTALAARAAANARNLKTDEAIADYQRAVALDPTLASAQYNLGTLLLKSNRPTEAEAAFKGAIEADPHYVYGHLQLAYLRQGQGRVADAMSALKHGMDCLPQDAKLKVSYAALLVELEEASRDQLQEALHHAESAIAIAAPEDRPMAAFTAARVQLRQGDPAAAQARARQSLELASRVKIDPQVVRSIQDFLFELDRRLGSPLVPTGAHGNPRGPSP